MPVPTTDNDDGPLPGQDAYDAYQAELGAAGHDGEEKERARIKTFLQTRVDQLQQRIDAAQPNLEFGHAIAAIVATELANIITELDPKPDTDAF